MKIIDLLKGGKSALLPSDTAILDSEILLAYVLGKDREFLLSNPDVEVDLKLADLYGRYLEQVAEGRPVAYILGEKEFYGLNFFVDERVLIPRPETEMLVEKALDYLRANDFVGKKYRILDVGTGSACISVAIARGFSEADGVIEQIDAVDVSDSVLEVAKMNVSQYSFENMIRLYQSDLLDSIDNEEKFDLIVTNLPYLVEGAESIGASVAKYEPAAALYGGKNGLELYKKLFQQIADKRVEFEVIIGEFGFGQSKRLRELLDKYFEQRWSIEKDLAGIDRIFIVS